MSSERFIPFHLPSIGEEEIQEVTSVLRSGWLTTGPRTAQFEREFAAYVQATHAQAVNSATAGLHLTLAALGIGPGDEVITTPLTFCATVNTILHVGAKAVLADVGADGNIDPSAIRSKITERTRAIMPVHLAGLPCDMDAIWQIAQANGLRVVEDAAHAVGTHYNGAPIGRDIDAPTASDAVVFSFYATKNLTTGEGGMVTTGSAELAAAVRKLTLHGITRDAWNRYTRAGSWYYEVVDCGFKYNLSDIQSAVGIHQLRKQERFVELRSRYAQLYAQLLGDLPEVELPATRLNSRHAWHLFILKLNLAMLDQDRSAVIEALRERGVGTSVHFIPIPLHPYYRDSPRVDIADCSAALQQYERSISLPLYPEMTEDDVVFVARAVRDVVTAFRRKTFAATAGTSQE